MYRLFIAIVVISLTGSPDPVTGGLARGADAPGVALDLSNAIPPAPPGPAARLSLDAEGGQSGRDWDGLKRDTLYFGFTQLGVIALLYASPESISGWSSDKKDEYSLEKYKHNISNPAWDSDDWWINYGLHPYWGGAYFVRAAERGYGDAPAFWYSALLSTMYEFGAEALFEEVSIQDMIFTPGLGYFVGKYFMSVRDGIRARVWAGESLTGTDKAKLFLTDPLGSVNRGINSLFGWDIEVSVRPVVTVSAEPPAAGGFARTPDDDPARATGVFTGLRLRVVW